MTIVHKESMNIFEQFYFRFFYLYSFLDHDTFLLYILFRSTLITRLA